ncbi:MAG: hypothetical protein IT266_07005 [Saprospiraceae bacterium]|nr:hypothetical protein [Saprospiraceae bacterium]
MNIALEPIGEQHFYLKVTIEPEDYEPQVKQELHKIRKNANLKGFRPGTAPESMIRKLYGEEVKADQLQKLLSKSIEDYRKENELNFLGDLLPLVDEQLSGDGNRFQFNFEVGITPSLSSFDFIDGLKPMRFEIEVEDSLVDEEVKRFRQRFSERTEVEGPAQEGDVVEIEAEEWAGEAAVADGVVTEFNILIGENLHDAMRDKLVGASVGDAFEFNIREVEKDLSEKDIYRYLLHIEKQEAGDRQVGDLFRGRVAGILRVSPAELNEALYKKAFGEETDVVDEQGLREKLRQGIAKAFSVEAEKFLDIELAKLAATQSGLNYPDAFLEKWLRRSFKAWEEKPEDVFAHDLLHFKEGLSWQHVRDYILETQQIEISYDEVANEIIEDLQGKYGSFNLPPESWAKLAQKTMENKEQALQYIGEIQNRKALQWIKGRIDIPVERLSLDAFREKTEKYRTHQH